MKKFFGWERREQRQRGDGKMEKEQNKEDPKIRRFNL